MLTIFFSSTPFAKTIPLEEWAKRDRHVRNVELSPNGEKLALLRIMRQKECQFLKSMMLITMSKRPFRMDSDPMEMDNTFTGRLMIRLYSRQGKKVRDKIDDFNRGVYEYSGGILTLDKIPKICLEKANFHRSRMELSAYYQNIQII